MNGLKTTSSLKSERESRFEAALDAAVSGAGAGLHGSIGTRNEKTVHAVLKNYYVPYPDEQEIRLCGHIADAVCEDGIFEIQTQQLYKLREKLSAFLPYARVTVVYPLTRRLSTVYIDADSGELVHSTRPREIRSLLKLFDELYPLRDLLTDENLRIRAAGLDIEKRVYFSMSELGHIPDLCRRGDKKKCRTERVPLALTDEWELDCPPDYRVFLPDMPGETFTKREICAAAGESRSSLRTEVLRAVGIIKLVGKKGRENLYKRG